MCIRDSLCAIAAPGHPLAGRKKVRLRELAEYPLLMREKGSAVREDVYKRQVPVFFHHPVLL